MVDFPQTKDQTALFEVALPGFHIPVAPKAGKTAPPPSLPPCTDPFASGLDTVLRFDVEHGVLLRHALGQRYDPVTGVRHMDTNPLPEDEPIKARLVPPSGLPEDLEVKLPDPFSVYDTNWPALQEWLVQFNLAHEVPATLG